MPTGGTPGFEQPPKLPEGPAESPEARPSFESSPSAEATGDKPSRPVVAASLMPSTPASADAKDPTLKGIESVLEEDLAETYERMDPELRRKFKKEGERVAGRIAEMVRKAKVKAREVLLLVTGWLKLIPGVNRFFLIQEAKIKTDKIVALAEEEKRNRGVL